jgi:predicted nucleotidyltransferase
MERELNEFVEKLKAAVGANLRAVVLYGSAVSGEFHEKHSNLNLLCIIADASPANLEKLHAVVVAWTRANHPAPLVFTLDELRRSADIFAIEFLDMKMHHRMLFGDDFFSALEVPTRYHRLQVERELRTDWLRLRQALLTAPEAEKAFLGLMVATVSSFATLFRHALIALGETPARTKREAVERIAKLCGGANAAGFDAILDFREGKRAESDIDIRETLRLYVDLVHAVTNEVDRRLEESH